MEVHGKYTITDIRKDYVLLYRTQRLSCRISGLIFFVNTDVHVPVIMSVQKPCLAPGDMLV